MHGLASTRYQLQWSVLVRVLPFKERERQQNPAITGNTEMATWQYFGLSEPVQTSDSGYRILLVVAQYCQIVAHTAMLSVATTSSGLLPFLETGPTDFFWRLGCTGVYKTMYTGNFCYCYIACVASLGQKGPCGGLLIPNV